MKNTAAAKSSSSECVYPDAPVPAVHQIAREVWNGHPERLPGGFVVIKPQGSRMMRAVCEIWTHPRGWELRLRIDGQGLSMVSVARSAVEMTASLEEWHLGMAEKGWQ